MGQPSRSSNSAARAAEILVAGAVGALIWVTPLPGHAAPTSAGPKRGPTKDEATDAQRAAARQAFERGRAAHRAKKYREAIRLYRRAMATVYSATLHYDIGLSYDELGERRAALAAYRRYLEELPHAPNRARVEARIAKLERQGKGGARDTESDETTARATAQGDGSPVASPPAHANSAAGGGDDAGGESGDRASDGQTGASSAQGVVRNASARRRPPRLTFDASVGPGVSLHAGGALASAAPTALLALPRVTYRLSSRFGLTFDPLLAIQRVETASGGDATTYHGLVALGVEYLPWHRLSLRAGVGPAFARMRDHGGLVAAANGVGATVSAQIAILSLARDWQLFGELRSALQWYPNDIGTVVQIGGGIGVRYSWGSI